MIVIYLILLSFNLVYIKAILFWLNLWQTKEYRLDRFWAEYGQGKKLIRFWLWAGGRKLHQPTYTIKALGICFLSLMLLAFSESIFLSHFSYWYLSLVVFLTSLFLLLPIIVAVAVFLFEVPTRLLKQIIYKKAARRIAEVSNLTVIGITGSYGKSSTKEFLAQILEKKFRVIKTPENVNTDIGVAKFVLNNINPLQPPFDKGGNGVVFIVEMGAYKRGEVKSICDIVKPQIGIITGINEQHLDLFGSFENIIDTKYELIECLSKDGLAVFNGENKYCLEMAGRWRGEKIIYKGDPDDPDIHPDDPDFPKHYLLNLHGVVKVARYLGMSEEEIKEVVKDIKLTDRMMKSFVGRGGALVIDDTYSANPNGVCAGLDFLAQQPQKTKIVVMPCLIELGEKAEDVHKEIGKKISEVCDLAIITTEDYFDIIKQEARDRAMLAVSPERVVELLKDKLNLDTIVLLEGRVAGTILSFLRKQESRNSD